MKHFNVITEWLRSIKCNQKILFALCVLSLSLPNFLLFFTESTSLLVRLTNIVLPLSAWWYVMTLLRRPGKMYWMLFLFVFFDAFQIVLLDIYGEAILAVDMFLNLATTNAAEAGEQLGGVLPAVAFVVIVYLPTLLWSVVSIYHQGLDNDFRKRQRRYASLGILAGVLMLCSCYMKEEKFSFIDGVYPVNVVDNLEIAIERTVKKNRYHNTSADFTFQATSSHDAGEREVYILVIGETARADNFGIYGYERATTPHLSAESNLHVFRDVLSQANVTHKSVPMILSAVSAENFDDIYHQKSIITAFKEAGFATSFFSNQRPNGSFIDFFGEEAHRSVFVKEDVGAETNVDDSVLLELVKDELGNSAENKHFIVLHTYGSHFNYCDRYPATESYFKPDRVTAVGRANRQAMVNAYDNSIRHTDKLLHGIIEATRCTGANACVMYLSDHGEDLYDDERNRYMHASPVPSYYQLRVPLFVWTSDGYDSTHNKECEALKGNVNKPVASNLVAFHTMLGLAGIDTEYRSDKYSLCSAKYSSPKRYYLNDHNEAQPMDKIGLKAQDEAMMRKHKIAFP